MLKKVELLGLDIEVEFDENEVKFDESEQMEVITTTDGRLIGWDNATNSWVQIKRWAD